MKVLVTAGGGELTGKISIESYIKYHIKMIECYFCSKKRNLHVDLASNQPRTVSNCFVPIWCTICRSQLRSRVVRMNLPPHFKYSSSHWKRTSLSVDFDLPFEGALYESFCFLQSVLSTCGQQNPECMNSTRFESSISRTSKKSESKRYQPGPDKKKRSPRSPLCSKHSKNCSSELLLKQELFYTSTIRWKRGTK